MSEAPNASKPAVDSVTAEIRQILSQAVEPEDSEAPGESLGKEAPGDADRGASLAHDSSSSAPDESGSLEDDTEASEDIADTGDDEPVDVESLAEHLEIEKAALYELEIPLGDGEKATLGELKDAFKEYGPVKEARQKVEREKEQYTRDVMATRHQINSMMMVANTPEKQALLQDMLQAAGPMQEQWERNQQQALLSAIPEWRDADTRIRDRDSIVSVGYDYGFSEPEITATRDARTLRLLRDFAKARAELAEMQKPAKREHAKPNAPGKTSSGKLTKRRLAQLKDRARKSPNLSDKRGYVQTLLTGN